MTTEVEFEIDGHNSLKGSSSSMALDATQPLDDRMVGIADYLVFEGNANDLIKRKIGPGRLRNAACSFKDLVSPEVHVGFYPHPAFHRALGSQGCRRVPHQRHRERHKGYICVLRSAPGRDDSST